MVVGVGGGEVLDHEGVVLVTQDKTETTSGVGGQGEGEGDGERGN